MQMLEEKTEVKKMTWKNPITNQVFSDVVDIDYYKSIQQEEICENLLLGSFNSEGNYVIPKPILQELLNVNKYITKTENGTYYLSSKIKSDTSFELKFVLNITSDNENNKKIAVLTLLENYNTLDNSQLFPMKTSIARYKDEDDIYFMQKVAKIFHIYDKNNDSDGKEEENEKLILEILKLLNSLKDYKKSFYETNEYLSKYYIDTVLNILKTHPGKFSEYILRKYNLIFDASKDKFGKPKYFRNLRYQLDKLLFESSHMCENAQLLEKISKVKNEYLTAKFNFEENIKASALKKEAKKVEAKKPIAKSSSAKSASKGKAKKPAGKAKASSESAKAPPFIDYSTLPNAKQETLTFTVKNVPEKQPKKFATEILDVVKSEMMKTEMLATLRVKENNQSKSIQSQNDIANIAENSRVVEL